MEKQQYINYDGLLYKKDDKLFTAQNRAFRYGDSLFETMHANGTEIQFYIEHHIRLISSMDKLKMEVPNSFLANTLKDTISRLLNKNRRYRGTRVRLSVFRQDGGLYTPNTNDISYLIESDPLPCDQYELNKEGLKIEIFYEMKKSIDHFSNLKTGNSLLLIMAGIYAKENAIDDVIILNQKDKLCESVSSNLFIIKGDNLYTPSLSEGCVAGVMRDQITYAGAMMGMNIYDECELDEESLTEADEIFLTNAISGIRWVQSFRNRRYYYKTTAKILNNLNKYAFGE